LARLFISHSSANNGAAVALRDWLAEQGFTDVFLDIDAGSGLAAGERWQEALKTAADRCEAVLFLISPAWIESKWCLAEFLLAKTLHKRIFGLFVEAVPLNRVPVEMTAEWQTCDLTKGDVTRPFDVTFGQQAERISFSTTALDMLRRGLDRAGLDARTFPWPPAGEPDRAPYRGLRALEPQDAAIFFGRDAMIVRGLDRLRGMAEDGVEPLMVVLGASGSGKSSFLRAGLLPRLTRDDVVFLTLPAIRPEMAVISGGAGLAQSLAGAFARLQTPKSLGSIKETIVGSADGLTDLLNELWQTAKERLVHINQPGTGPAILISVDQAEELFNPDGAEEAKKFLALLATALAPRSTASSPRVIVLATIRSDRYEQLQEQQVFADVKRQLFDLPPLPSAEFKSVIEGPADRVVEAGGVLRIDPALTEQLIADAMGADALPLLGFTLERLYTDYGADGRLTLDEYKKLGGVQGSIEAAVVHALAEPGRAPAIPAARDEQFARMRAAFVPWLARIEPTTGAPMRRVARLDEIPADSRAIVERLVGARLLVADHRAGIDVIEVAHESLLRQWPALASWLEADAGDLKAIEGVERAANEWNRNERQGAWLDHRAERLLAAERLTMRQDFHRRLGEEGNAYLNACRAREDAERREKEEGLAREQARLAEVAAAQERTARTQRIARWSLGLAGLAVMAGLALGVWQRITLNTQQAALDLKQTNLFVELSVVERLRANIDAALRFAVDAARLDLARKQSVASLAGVELATAVLQSGWSLSIGGHQLSVSSAAFSPDGTRIVSASMDKTARIWDATTGKQLQVLTGHQAGLWTVVFSPDGTKVLTASEDKTARIWDAVTGKQIAVLNGHTDKVSSAAFSPDGKRVVTSSFDKTARIWDATTFQQLTVLIGHTDTVQTAFFSPDGTRIVTASDDTTARIWDAATGQQLSVLRGHQNSVYSAVFSPDGTRVATGSDDTTARVWDVDTAKQIAVMQGHDDYVNTVAFSVDGTKILTASADKTARIWDAATGAQLAVLQGHEDYVNTAAYSIDGKRIVTASRDKTVRVWDVSVGTELLILRGHDNWLASAEYSADGTRIVTASQDKTAKVWDAATGLQQITLTGHDAALSGAVFSPDGKRIVTASEDKTARIWDASTGKQLTVLSGHGNWVMDAAFSPDGTRIATASWDQTARVWDAVSGSQLMVLQGHAGVVDTAAFSPDGARIVTASRDSTAKIWDAKSGNQLLTLTGHDGPVYSASFSSDGKRVLTASQDRTARIWDATTGTPLVTLSGHEDAVWSAAFSPDGTRVITASQDRTARIWDAASGREIAILRGHDNWVVHAAFSPDGSRAVTASRDKTARVWNGHPPVVGVPDLVTQACQKLLGSLATLTRDDMELAGYPDNAPLIDICKGAD
jgi:WD40 repeat protein